MARCGCGGECSCALTAGDNIQVSGSGTPTVPWVVTALTDCAEVRQCISGDDGIDYDDTTGVIGVCVSPNAGNNITRDVNGCLFVAGAPGTVQVGCGLVGDGSAGTPVTVNTPAWPFACDPTANGSAVTCDTNGQLRGEPPYHTYFFQSLQQQDFPANPAVPAGDDVIVHTFSFDVTNPDPCRPMRVLQWRDLDVDFNLPAGADAASGISTDEMTHVTNHGTATAFDQHTQVGKVTQPNATLAPGASVTLTIEAALGKGTGGATYNRIQGTFRVWMMPV
jgi:hypothetical protein